MCRVFFSRYISAFRNLNVNKRGNKISPHKPILLLAVMELVENGEIVSPFIPISRELEDVFSRIWHQYVPDGEGHSCAMQYPFFYMRSEPFWRLEPLPWHAKKSSYSLKELRRNYYGAIIDAELFEAFREDGKRKELRQVLVEMYLGREHLISDRTGSAYEMISGKLSRAVVCDDMAAEPENSFPRV